MRIRFGLALDGQRANIFKNALNDLDVGPLGMINILETQLGLLRKDTPQAQRVLQYRDTLRRCDTSSRFYHGSFQADELGTAATLLSWRDQWHLHGWDTQADMTAAPRLQDMLTVERSINGNLAPSVGERLALVLQTLPQRQVDIEQIELVDPLEAFPQRWRDVLAGLRVCMGFLPDGLAPGLLGQVQVATAAMSRGKSPPKLQWQPDDSLRIVQAESRFTAGAWLARQLRQPDATLLVAQDGALLDELLTAAGQPRQGFREATVFRPALQVAPLAMALIWQPLNIHGLLEFLTHPICPIPAVARDRLARHFAETPGVGGPAWEKCLQNIEEACGKQGIDWPEVRQRIRLWLEHPRHTPAERVPAESVRDRLQSLTDYFRSRQTDNDPIKKLAFMEGFSQSRSCLRAVETLIAQGEDRIGPQQLDTLLAQATAQGATNPLQLPEVGACRTTTDPAAAIDPAEHVLWWQLATPSLPSPYPWSRSEQVALQAAGVQLPDITVALDHLSRCWLRPILQARQSLTLVLPPPGTEVHPVWLMLESLFEKEGRPTALSLESLLEQGDTDMHAIEHRPLPAYQRWWSLPSDVHITSRDKESFSSLESYLFNPYQWVLNYSADLKPSTLLEVSDYALLYGKLAHNLVERYYRQPDALAKDEAALKSWFESAFDDIVAREGAVLLMPGRREDMEDLRFRLRRAMLHLRNQLAEAGVVKVEPELELSGHFQGGQIGGFADLVVTRKDGHQAVVDMKWAGGKKYPDKLAKNSHLQLAIYGELLRQRTGQWPGLAYFILESGRMYATEQDDFFPGASRISKAKGVAEQGASHLWQRFLKTWAWRKDLLDQGQIEVALEVDEEAEAPDDGMKLEALNPKYNNYRFLAGWGDEQ